MNEHGEHHWELFLQDGRPYRYGWQCFTCKREEFGFWSLEQAEKDAKLAHQGSTPA